MIESLRQAFEIMHQPKEFFKKVHDDKGLRREVQFLTVLSFVIFIFLTYTYLDQLNSVFSRINDYLGEDIFTLIQVNIQNYLYIYLALAVSFILISFMRYWVTHWFVILLGGRQGYQQTYRAMVYSLAPEYVYAPLFAISMISLPFVIAWGNAIAWTIWLVVFVLYMIPSLYEIYLRIVALSILQKISYWRSFAAIFILGYVTQLILLFALTFVLSLIFGLILYPIA